MKRDRASSFRHHGPAAAFGSPDSGGRARRGPRRRARFAGLGAAGILAVLAVLVLAAEGGAQAQIGAFTGAYGRGAGGHPHVYLAVGGRLGLQVTGPLSIEAEALHVPAKVEGRDVDLFAYRVNAAYEIPFGDIRPFVLGGIGFHQWRTWLCRGTSCASPPGPGQKFRYDRGRGYTLGLGSRFRASEPLWFRIDGRFEHHDFQAPSVSDWLLTMGVELQP